MPRAPKTIIDIDLSGTPYAEYKVRVASVSLGTLLALGDQPDRLRAGAGLAAVRELVELFADGIEDWNITDDEDATIVPSVDSVLALDLRFARTVIKTWLNAMLGEDEELGKGSTSGQQSAPPNFPMEAL
jgi:hypothetical protein